MAEKQVVLERLFEVSVLMAEHMERGLSDRGLTRARAKVIRKLYHEGATTHRGLSEALAVTPRNVTGLVDALEGLDFVARRSHPSDRRASLVMLTDRGQAAAAAIHADEQEFASLLLDHLEGEEQATFSAILESILERLRGATASF